MKLADKLCILIEDVTYMGIINAHTSSGQQEGAA